VTVWNSGSFLVSRRLPQSSLSSVFSPSQATPRGTGYWTVFKSFIPVGLIATDISLVPARIGDHSASEEVPIRLAIHFILPLMQLLWLFPLSLRLSSPAVYQHFSLGFPLGSYPRRCIRIRGSTIIRDENELGQSFSPILA
jgi:hypothetical protein